MNVRWWPMILTFPGVIFHEIGHYLFCLITGTKVRKVCFLRFDNPMGYVVHDQPKGFFRMFLITVGPFLFNTALALVMYYLVLFQRFDQFWMMPLLMWLGFSAGTHSFPSKEDADGLWSYSIRAIKRLNLIAILGLPIAALLWLVSATEVFFTDFIYSIFLFIILPYIIEIIQYGSVFI